MVIRVFKGGLLLLLLGATFTYGKTVEIGAGWARAPYIIPADHTGFELDVMRQILAKMGYDSKLIYVPYASTIQMLKNGNVDLILTVDETSGINKEQLSDSYITYQNVVISLKRKKLDITAIQDLSELSVIGFQSATEVLGKEYANAIKDSGLYIEMADQKKQVELFLLGNVEAIVIDINVFDYLSKEISGLSQFEKVNIHPLFPLNSFQAGFKDKTLKESFNHILKDYLLSQDYKKLQMQYQIKQAVLAL